MKPARAPEAPPPAAARPLILVVEDDDAMRTLIGEVLAPLDATVASARVTAEILRQGRTRSIMVFKKKRRKNYRRTKGHRQAFTQIRITGIETK